MTDSTITIYHSRPKAESNSTVLLLTCSTFSPLARRTQFPVHQVSKASIKHENDADFTTKKYLFLINSSALFLIFWSKVRVFRHFLQLSDINTLNSIYNKHLHNFFTPKYGSRTTGHESRKMQNEPNFITQHLKILICLRQTFKNTYPPKAENEHNFSFTHLLIHSFAYLCKTNPI